MDVLFGFQLHTWQDFTRPTEDFAATLQRIANIG